eukprot:Polyplicarium_translucidae@DN2970_c0_g1_i5.p3
MRSFTPRRSTLPAPRCVLGCRVSVVPSEETPGWSQQAAWRPPSSVRLLTKILSGEASPLAARAHCAVKEEMHLISPSAPPVASVEPSLEYVRGDNDSLGHRLFSPWNANPLLLFRCRPRCSRCIAVSGIGRGGDNFRHLNRVVHAPSENAAD